jgi:predicted negative regulator of RcsB-dependent stress response
MQMNKTILGLVVALLIAVAVWFGYRSMSGGNQVAAPAAPAASAALPDTVLAQIKTGIDAVPNLTAEQKTAITGCVTTTLSSGLSAEEMAKIATDAPAQQKLAATMATGMKDCLTKAGVGG